MSNTFKIIYSTLAVVMVVNTVIFALPIVGQAQAIEKQAIQQAELTQVQKAELEKAQKEAKLAMYKELDLTKAEITFMNNPKNNIEALNKEMDLFVTYDKEGYAFLNETKAKKSKKFYSIYIIIAKKQVVNYNKNIKKFVAPAKKSSSNKIASAVQPEYITTYKVEDRGFSGNILSNEKFQTPLSRNGCNRYVEWYNYRMEWWGYISLSIRLTDCATDGIVVTTGLTSAISAALALTPLAPAAGPIAVAAGVVAAATSWMRWYCGYDGFVVKGKGLLWALAYSRILYTTCD
jgi:hypothetical protein